MNSIPPSSNQEPTSWAKCSSCKKPLSFGARYYLCSVSTCRHSRTGLKFCSVPCWDAHLGFANHRSSFAEEAVGPSKEAYEASLSEEQPIAERQPVKKIVSPTPTPSSETTALPQTDTLIVVSKVKQLIREQSQFNTSECCIKALTEKVVVEAMNAIERARAAGRKTVMGRDVTWGE